MAPSYWLVKQEPGAYSWDDFVKEGETYWDGVRNYQARNNLRAMKKSDLVFFYHSVSDKQVVGVAKRGGGGLAEQFAVGKEALQFRLAVLDRVGGVNHVLHFILAEVATDRSFIGNGRVGRPDHFADAGDGILTSQRDCHHR